MDKRNIRHSTPPLILTHFHLTHFGSLSQLVHHKSQAQIKAFPAAHIGNNSPAFPPPFPILSFFILFLPLSPQIWRKVKTRGISSELKAVSRTVSAEPGKTRHEENKFDTLRTRSTTSEASFFPVTASFRQKRGRNRANIFLQVFCAPPIHSHLFCFYGIVTFRWDRFFPVNHYPGYVLGYQRHVSYTSSHPQRFASDLCVIGKVATALLRTVSQGMKQ